jgi:hypothetical protein
MDTTWANSLKVDDKPISLGKGDSPDNGGKGGKGEQPNSTDGAGKGGDQTPDTPLLIAAREGIVEIFRRLKMMKGIMEHRLFSMIDKRGYTILHHAADMNNYNGGTRAGPALQLQEELQWFEVI